MNAKQISEALGRKPTAAEAHRLILAVDERRTEIRARISSIQASRNPTFPEQPERARAIASGPEAVRALDREIEELNHEVDYLAPLERSCFEAHGAAELSEARGAFNASRKQLPFAMSQVREALATLDAAIDRFNRVVEGLAQFDRLNESLPLDDDGLAELLALRASVWTAREVQVLMPPDNYKRSCEIYYELRGHESPVLVPRRRVPYPTDSANW